MLTKKPKQHATISKLKAGSPVPVQFNLQDNGDATFTVLGVDAAGNTVDVSTVATLTASSDNTATVTVDAPVGMTSAIHAPTAPAPAVGATANVTLTVTWNDGSVGPFTITWPISIGGSAVSGITVVPGTPTVH
jgi:hypothetical protein